VDLCVLDDAEIDRGSPGELASGEAELEAPTAQLVGAESSILWLATRMPIDNRDRVHARVAPPQPARPRSHGFRCANVVPSLTTARQQPENDEAPTRT